MTEGVEQDKASSINDGGWRQVKNEHSGLMTAKVYGYYNLFVIAGDGRPC